MEDELNLNFLFTLYAIEGDIGKPFRHEGIDFPKELVEENTYMIRKIQRRKEKNPLVVVEDMKDPNNVFALDIAWLQCTNNFYGNSFIQRRVKRIIGKYMPSPMQPNIYENIKKVFEKHFS